MSVHILGGVSDGGPAVIGQRRRGRVRALAVYALGVAAVVGAVLARPGLFGLAR